MKQWNLTKLSKYLINVLSKPTEDHTMLGVRKQMHNVGRGGCRVQEDQEKKGICLILQMRGKLWTATVLETIGGRKTQRNKTYDPEKRERRKDSVAAPKRRLDVLPSQETKQEKEPRRGTEAAAGRPVHGGW
ncbi:hypothetical protein IW262DRAFT_1296169 [Armillaria fumosa]|nr:hypothetical protein IW262DRAFT_1296169 [Armillaria fumosa]